MKINEKVIREDDKIIVKRITYSRDGSKLKICNVDLIIRELAFIYRHAIHPIKKLVIEEGRDIEYTQEVVESKSTTVRTDESE